MGFASNQTKSIFGRQMGLQSMSSNMTGSGRSGEVPDFVVGPEDIRRNTIVGTTAKNLPAYGVSRVNGTSAGSSAVYTLDPPIPGVMAVLSFESTANGPVYVKTANGELFISTQGTTFNIIKSTNNTVGAVVAIGVTTAIWQLLPGLSTGTFALTTTT
jgi:hypothetical protein